VWFYQPVGRSTQGRSVSEVVLTDCQIDNRQHSGGGLMQINAGRRLRLADRLFV
jgi:hypothetical protein